jgi:hypothetical protein
MQIEMVNSAALYLLVPVMAFNLALTWVAHRAAGRRGLSARLVALSAFLLGFVPPLNVAYLAVLALFRHRPPVP